jgi:hypothetical protein
VRSPWLLMKFHPHAMGGCGADPGCSTAADHLKVADAIPGQDASYRLKALDCHGRADDGSIGR